MANTSTIKKTNKVKRWPKALKRQAKVSLGGRPLSPTPKLTPPPPRCFERGVSFGAITGYSTQGDLSLRKSAPMRFGIFFDEKKLLRLFVIF